MGAKKGEFTPKTIESLENLEAKRLLKYYRAEQERFRRFRSFVECECCGTMDWEFTASDENDAKSKEKNKQKFTDWTDYLKQVKSVLNKKNHVSKR